MKARLKVKNQNLYITNDGSFKLTVNKSNAFQFVNREKAKNFLKSLPSNINEHEYVVEDISDELGGNTTDVFLDTLIKLKETFSLSKYELELCRSTVAYLNKLIDTIITGKKANEYLSKYDSALVDISHYVEFRTLNKDECIKVVELQKTILSKRRICKNKIESATTLRRIGLDYFNRLAKYIDNLNNRKYTPRLKK